MNFVKSLDKKEVTMPSLKGFLYIGLSKGTIWIFRIISIVDTSLKMNFKKKYKMVNPFKINRNLCN